MLPLLLGSQIAVGQVAGAYRIDFHKATYVTDVARAKDQAELRKLTDRLVALKGKVGSSPEALLTVFRLRDRAYAIESKLYIHYRLHYLLDTSDAKDLERANDSGSDYETRTSFLAPEIGSIKPDHFARFAKQEPKLRSYAFAFEKERRTTEHRLPDDQERLLKTLEPLATGWQYELYEQSRETATPDRRLRFFILRNLVTASNRLASLRHHRDEIEASLEPLFLTRTEVDRTLRELSKAKPLAASLDQIKRAHPVDTPKPIPIEQGLRDVRDAISPLGASFLREWDVLTDPRNGPIDIAGGPNRSGLGTGWGFPASQPSILYWPEYTGEYDDLDRGLAHEGGHALHFSLMRANHVLPCYSDGPNYFFESFAIFNQLLLADSLYRKTGDRFYLAQILDKARYPIFLAFFASFEDAMHDGLAKGWIRSPEDLDTLEQRQWSRFMTVAAFDKDKARWLTTEHFVSVPLYEINYVYASLLALKYFEMFRKDPANFAGRYAALVSNGFDAPPSSLLRRFLGIDLKSPKLVDESLSYLRANLPRLEK